MSEQSTSISSNGKTLNTHPKMRQFQFLLFAFLAVAVSVRAKPQDKTERPQDLIVAKAPSLVENCNCQCHHYTWQDTFGKIQVYLIMEVHRVSVIWSLDIWSFWLYFDYMVNGQSKFFEYMVISAKWSTLSGQNCGPFIRNLV